MQAGKTNKTTHCVLFQLNAPMEFATCKSQVSCRATREALHKVSGSREALNTVSESREALIKVSGSREALNKVSGSSVVSRDKRSAQHEQNCNSTKTNNTSVFRVFVFA